MTKHVAFLRAVNVAGHACVKMTDLQDVFAAAGCVGVTTHIQSGNVIFDIRRQDAPAVFERVRAGLRRLLGHEPGVVIRTVRQIWLLTSRISVRGSAEP